MARTPAGINRLWDVVPLIAADHRIAITFAVDEGSAFSRALAEELAAKGALVEQWEEAVRGEYDLALAASDNGELHRLRAPLMRLPHGVGYHRTTPDGTISGLRAESLLHEGEIVPETLVVAHDDQLGTVRAVAPELTPKVLVAGDPCMDRIRASETGRAGYRKAFGADGRRLVVLCSTWGRFSLYGKDPDLPAKVTAALPADHYRVALVLHPNVWSRHGTLQVRAWLRHASEAGMIVVPPEEGWRAALVAADVVVSDHGSLTCYAVGIERPVLIAADGGPEVVPHSPMRRLLDRLPRLDRQSPLRQQLDDTIRQGDIAGDIAESIFSRPGRAAALLRQRMYEMLRLPEPPWHAVARPVPVPAVRISEPDAFVVQAQQDGEQLVLQRFPVVPSVEERPSGYLVARDDGADPGLLERAAVVWSEENQEPRELLRRWPGARIAVCRNASGDITAELRDGTEVVAQGSVSVSMAGSVLYWWDVHNRRRQQKWHVDAGTLSLRATRPEKPRSED
ncbi:hypothetical protein [Kutzneria chonburiensis]|uniref:Translation initiation factor 2 n=1 Tax=Kutzneria chonburiensis TaxID=1483604 RepID=A0ABV6MJ19_9PSEU|nr:hypothetical protein [Kutzneria chonburiensis]